MLFDFAHQMSTSDINLSNSHRHSLLPLSLHRAAAAMNDFRSEYAKYFRWNTLKMFAETSMEMNTKFTRKISSTGVIFHVSEFFYLHCVPFLLLSVFLNIDWTNRISSYWLQNQENFEYPKCNFNSDIQSHSPKEHHKTHCMSRIQSKSVKNTFKVLEWK